ncbi:MAG: hypothetical protein HY819_13860 [Acidobacteria bacterium]|nr:hypothetical protein [Acidobacteriota bacterium]
MTREEAVLILKRFFKMQHVDSPGLNENNVGGASIGDLELYFEYIPKEEALNCSALIYSFREEPKPGVIDGFKEEEQSGRASTGGGFVDYQPENKGLFLTRSYKEFVEDLDFLNDMEALLGASRVWSQEVLPKVAERVFQN